MVVVCFCPGMQSHQVSNMIVAEYMDWIYRGGTFQSMHVFANMYSVLDGIANLVKNTLLDGGTFIRWIWGIYDFSILI